MFIKSFRVNQFVFRAELCINVLYHLYGGRLVHPFRNVE